MLPPLQQEPPPSSSSAEPGQGSLRALQGEDPESREEAGLSVEEEPGPGHAKH